MQPNAANFLLPLSTEGLDTLKNIWNSATQKLQEATSIQQEDHDSGEPNEHVLLSHKVTLKASPFCHESHHTNSPLIQRELRGWVLDAPCESPVSSLPIPTNLFHGVSIAMCEASEEQILNLMQNISDTKQRLGNIIDKVIMLNALHPASSNLKCSWARCRPSIFGGHPTSLHHVFKDKKDGTLDFLYVGEDGSQQATPIIDSEEWIPELSPDGFVGFYHRWQNTTQGNRLCLYCVCQSYLPDACREFADTVYKLGSSCSSGCVALSEEAQWLRSVCSRNRARVIARVCKGMGIRVPVVRDYCSVNGGRYCPTMSVVDGQDSPQEELVAVITNETLHHDIAWVVVNSATKKTLSKKIANATNGPILDTKTANTKQYLNEESAMVRLLNYCCETRTAFNGVACVMAPWEGMWIFEGLNPVQDLAIQPLSGVSDFGKPYGDFVLCTAAPQVSHATVTSHSQRKRGLIYSCGISSEYKSHSLWRLKQPDSTKLTANTLLTSQHQQQSHKPNSSMLGMEGLEDIVIQAYHNSIQRRKIQEEANNTTESNEDPFKYIREHKGKQYFLTFDEHVLHAMSKLGWSRTQGIIKFMPLACGTFEHWSDFNANRC